MAVPLQIQVSSVVRLSVNWCTELAIFFRCYKNVQERHGTIYSCLFTGKLDVWITWIYVFQETASVGFPDDDEDIINISLLQSRGNGDVLMAWTSRSSINKLTTMGLIGEPIAAPSVCSQNLHWNEKYVFLRQNSSRQEMCFTVIDVLRCNSLSYSRCFFMMLTAGCIGTDVKSAFTS